MSVSRRNFNWKPSPDDDNEYVWRNGYWQLVSDEDDNLDLEEFEERRREKIAIRNEY